MTTYEPDPDVVRWGLHLIDLCGLSNAGSCGSVTRYDPDLSHVEYVREGYCEPECAIVENDEVIAHALQEELSRLAAEEASGNIAQEHLQSSILAQDWLGPSKRHGTGHGFDNKAANDYSKNMEVADNPSKKKKEADDYSEKRNEGPDDSSRKKNEDVDEMGIPGSSYSSGENLFIGDDMPSSLDIADEYALDGEVGKRLNQMVPIPHVPKINGEMPSVDEEISDHQRLLDRLQLYDLIENKVQGDGNCQFRALSDQLYRSPEHHKFVREQVVNQLKSHPAMYEGYVPMAYGDYLKKMSKSGEWGDHVTLQAAADTYGIKIFVLTSFKDTCYIEILPHFQKSERVIFVSFWAEVHYNSIYPEGELPVSEDKKKKKWWAFGS